MNLLRQLEVVLLSGGALLLGWCSAAYLDRTVSSHLEFQRFASQRPGNLQQQNETVSNLRQWSQKRIAAYTRALTVHVALPLSVIRISRIGLQAPVLDGTDEWTLNRGVGHIEGTVSPGERGNVGIAGHRDGFFRALKDVVIGDTIELDLRERVEFYRVTNMLVVDPSDISVLKDRSLPSLTLVTCYPFYFVGNAPKRYVVQAVRIGSSASTAPSNELSAGVSAGHGPQIPEPSKPIKEMIQ
jgi:sortase A